MSLEAYVTNLMKERNPRGFDAAFAGFLFYLLPKVAMSFLL